jgi:hypothetical protein
MTYTSDGERYVVSGRPVRVLDQCGRQTIGRTLTFDRGADTIVVDGDRRSRTRTVGDAACPES